MIRTFCAVSPSEEILAALAHLQHQLRCSPVGDAAKYVRPDSIHLTLRFLGYVEERLLERVHAAAQEAAHATAPFPLRLEGLGCFPNLRHPRVLWAGVSDLQGMMKHLHRALEESLEREGFRLADRRFSPHLTIARIKRHAHPGRARDLAGSLAQLPCDAGIMTVDTIHVIRSELCPNGPIYSVMCSAPLG